MVVSEARTQTSSSATLHGLLEDSADLARLSVAQSA